MATVGVKGLMPIWRQRNLVLLMQIVWT